MHHSRATHIVLLIYGVICLGFSYIPIIATGLASFAESPYLSYPLRSYNIGYYVKALHNEALMRVFFTSLQVAIVVALVAMVIGFLGGLAFGRYRWRLRKTFQKFALLPIFFPQPVLGLSLLIWFNTIGMTPNWITTVIAHLVWIGPIATLIVAIQAYSFDPELEEAARDMNASMWRVFSQVTLPLLWPSTMAAGLFAFLLSWGNFGLSLYTTGVDTTLPVWAYSEMIQSYTPMVPVMGTFSVALSVVALIISIILLLIVKWARSGRRVPESDTDNVSQTTSVRKESSDV